MSNAKDPSVTAARMQRFASFFKNYMGVSAVVTAALPIPITAIEAIPVYASQKTSLATYTSLLCFLLLAYLFYVRHSIGSILFVHRHRRRLWARLLEALPLMLILGCLLCVFEYHTQLTNSIQRLKENAQFTASPSHWPQELERRNYEVYGSGVGDNVVYLPTTARLLTTQSADEVPAGTLILSLYLGIFLCAEAAFVLMALREHLQDLLGIDDKKIMEAIGTAPAQSVTT